MPGPPASASRRPVAGRSAATAAEPPWPGASTRTTSRSRASAGASGPQHRRFWPKPWTSTIRGRPPPGGPSRSLASVTARDSYRVSSPPPAAPDPAAVQATFTATLVDEWARAGLADAVVCPGSRSTPLALALAAHAGVRLHVHHDERSAGFFALGLGLATVVPAVVLTTSGTAAAELHPAVVEAGLSAVP